MITKTYSDVEHAVINLARLFDCVPYRLMVELINGMTDPPNAARSRGIISTLAGSGDIFLADGAKAVRGTDRRDIAPDIKNVRALWVFAKYIGTCGLSFNIAKYPGQMFFSNSEGLWRITVLQSSDFRELKALKLAADFDGLTEIIVSPYDDFDSIDENLLPSREFKFVRMDSSEDPYAVHDAVIYTISAEE